MTYTKPEGRTWIQTELNDPVKSDPEYYNWMVRNDPGLHIRTTLHRAWCRDPDCGSLRGL